MSHSVRHKSHASHQGSFFWCAESPSTPETGRDLVLNPPQSGEPLNYFMYPYAEADGKPLNEDLYGFNLGYKITFREI